MSVCVFFLLRNSIISALETNALINEHSSGSLSHFLAVYLLYTKSTKSVLCVVL